MEKDEQQIEEYIARNGIVKEQEKPQKIDAEKQVESKAREAGPLSASVLQKRSRLEPSKLESRIGQISAKHAGHIDEIQLRQRIAKHLETHDEEISEADLVRIQGELLVPEQEHTEQLGVSPPPFINDSLNAAGDRARQAADYVLGLRTPGGVGFLVFVLIFFIWVVVPVNDANQTRLQLLWGVLTGQVGWSQSIKDQESQWLNQAEAQSGVQDILPNFGGGSRSIATVPFIPSFDE